jgi:hypothetical protein
MSEKHDIAREFAWAATFDLLDCLRPVIPAENVEVYFNAMYHRMRTAIAEALIAQDRERKRGGKAATQLAKPN